MLSETVSIVCVNHQYVSIPFREFKCCRQRSVPEPNSALPDCFNPFQGIQVLSEQDYGVLQVGAREFQSLSGNSSVVGAPQHSRLSLPLFRFNPFQGIQVLSGAGGSGMKGADNEFQSLSGNSSVVGHQEDFQP